MSDLDAARLGHLLQRITNECSVCGCHGDSCKLEDGERCVWTNRSRTVCSNPHCVVKASKQQRNYKWATKRAERDRRRPRKKGKAA